MLADAANPVLVRASAGNSLSRTSGSPKKRASPVATARVRGTSTPGGM
jgi:hypothetical protein